VHKIKHVHHVSLNSEKKTLYSVTRRLLYFRNYTMLQNILVRRFTYERLRYVMKRMKQHAHWIRSVTFHHVISQFTSNGKLCLVYILMNIRHRFRHVASYQH
jgi:hypothetical protein